MCRGLGKDVSNRPACRSARPGPTHPPVDPLLSATYCWQRSAAPSRPPSCLHTNRTSRARNTWPTPSATPTLLLLTFLSSISGFAPPPPESQHAQPVAESALLCCHRVTHISLCSGRARAEVAQFKHPIVHVQQNVLQHSRTQQQAPLPCACHLKLDVSVRDRGLHLMHCGDTTSHVKRHLQQLHTAT